LPRPSVPSTVSPSIPSIGSSPKPAHSAPQVSVHSSAEDVVSRAMHQLFISETSDAANASKTNAMRTKQESQAEEKMSDILVQEKLKELEEVEAAKERAQKTANNRRLVQQLTDKIQQTMKRRVEVLEMEPSEPESAKRVKTDAATEEDATLPKTPLQPTNSQVGPIRAVFRASAAYIGSFW